MAGFELGLPWWEADALPTAPPRQPHKISKINITQLIFQSKTIREPLKRLIVLGFGFLGFRELKIADAEGRACPAQKRGGWPRLRAIAAPRNGELQSGRAQTEPLAQIA